MHANTLDFIQSCIKTIPDYPKPGILFRDITSLVEHGEAFKATIDLLVERFRGCPLAKVVGTEARGFIFGAPVAAALGLGCGAMDLSGAVFIGGGRIDLSGSLFGGPGCGAMDFSGAVFAGGASSLFK